MISYEQLSEAYDKAQQDILRLQGDLQHMEQAARRVIRAMQFDLDAARAQLGPMQAQIDELVKKVAGTPEPRIILLNGR